MYTDYGHGGDIRGAAHEAGAGINPEDIIDFSASVAPLGPSPEAIGAITGALKGVSNYPEPVASEFLREVARYHSLPEGLFAAGNGSVEFIYLLPRLLATGKALIVEPAFSEYRRALEIAGIEAVSFMTDEDHYSVNTERLLGEIKSRSYGMLFIANPSNPAGGLTPHRELVRIINACEETDTFMVLDEAFCDFTEAASMKAATLGYKKFVILRSMTKFFSIAGLRLGYVITHPATAELIRGNLPPWSVNSLAAAAGTAALKDKAHIKRVREWYALEKTTFFNALSGISGLRVLPSAANFFTIKLEAGYDRASASRLRETLLSKNILIRDLSNFRGLGDSFFRVALRGREDNELLIKTLSECLRASVVSI